MRHLAYPGALALHQTRINCVREASSKKGSRFGQIFFGSVATVGAYVLPWPQIVKTGGGARQLMPMFHACRALQFAGTEKVNC